VDSFALIILGGLAVLLLAVILLGIFHPRSGADVLDWKPTRSIETEAQLELDDVAQMIEAQNARRRRTGRPEIDEEEFRARVAAEEAEHNRRGAAALDDELPPA
jgi:hypothetical protein